eukprot:5643547-Pyramimonas_sp.AAC.1
MPSQSPMSLALARAVERPTKRTFCPVCVNGPAVPAQQVDLVDHHQRHLACHPGGSINWGRGPRPAGGSRRSPPALPVTKTMLKRVQNNITSFYGSSCANNGKGELNTPEPSYSSEYPLTAAFNIT